VQREVHSSQSVNIHLSHSVGLDEFSCGENGRRHDRLNPEYLWEGSSTEAALVPPRWEVAALRLPQAAGPKGPAAHFLQGSRAGDAENPRRERGHARCMLVLK
jgi:hypothetical protein